MDERMENQPAKNTVRPYRADGWVKLPQDMTAQELAETERRTEQ